MVGCKWQHSSVIHRYSIKARGLGFDFGLRIQEKALFNTAKGIGSVNENQGSVGQLCETQVHRAAGVVT